MLGDSDAELVGWIVHQFHYGSCETEQSSAEVVQVLLRLLGEGFDWLPPFLLFDLIAVLDPRARYRLKRSVMTANEAHFRALYENAVLGPMLRHPQRRELIAQFDLGLLGQRQRAWLLGQVLDELFPRQEVLDLVCSIPQLKISQLRANIPQLLAQLSEEGDAEAVPSPIHFSENFWLHWCLLIERRSTSISWKSVFTESQRFVLERWQSLSTPSSRVAFDQLLQVIHSVGELPVERLTVHKEPPEVESKYVDEGSYPTGGLNGISNRGTLESLLRSELVYMNDSYEQESDADLFGIKYLESELLYYVRDDAQMLRMRRQVRIVIDLGVYFGFKEPDLEHQYGLYAMAIAVSIIHHLKHVFATDALRIELCLVGTEVQTFAEETDLLSVMLADDLLRDVVRVRILKSIDFQSISVDQFEHAHKAYLLWIHDSEGDSRIDLDAAQMAVVACDLCAQLRAGVCDESAMFSRQIAWDLLCRVLSTAFA